VRQVLPHIRDWGIDTLLILSGDHLYSMDYRQFLARHYESDADVTVSVIPCSQREASEFGLLKTDSTGRITEFKEKPKNEALEEMRVDTTTLGLSAEEAMTRPFLASMGIYVFKYDLIEELLAQDPTAFDFGRNIIPAAIHTRNLQAFMFDGYWEDIGTISAFYEANIDLTSPMPKFNLFNADAPIYTRSRYLPPSKVHNCEVRNSIISEGCIINGASILRSIVGLRGRIEAGARIEGSILMGSDYYQSIEDMRSEISVGRPRLGVGENTIIRRAIIDKNTRIGANVRLVNEAGIEHADGDGSNYYIRDRIIIVPKNAVIPDGTVV
jgi:glucose-1-phosphate adenylyltransferase